MNITDKELQEMESHVEDWLNEHFYNLMVQNSIRVNICEVSGYYALSDVGDYIQEWDSTPSIGECTLNIQMQMGDYADNFSDIDAKIFENATFHLSPNGYRVAIDVDDYLHIRITCYEQI